MTTKEKCPCGNPLSIYNQLGICNACLTDSAPDRPDKYEPKVPVEKLMDFSNQVHRSQYHR